MWDWFSVKATIISFPWPSIQKQKTKNKIKRMPGKKSLNDFNNWEMNLNILRPKPGEDLVIN